MSILKFLGLDEKASPAARSLAETDAIREIAGELQRLDREKARYIAKFAYVLSRVASVDLQITEEETRVMERILIHTGGLEEDEARLVVRMTKERNLKFGGTDNFLVTREFRRIATHEQKVALLDCLFAVSAAEGHISVVEDNEISQIAKELGLEHRTYIAVRSKHRDRLGVFQNLPRGIAPRASGK
ncbi:MAG: TerB family tellurite resistance protein [Bryobacteraceae bacterium]|nr:TerB family tellurite resistance protein [Bryobacteraceae bacterium]